MTTFILVTGARQGSWYYRDTAKALRDAGYTVFTNTYTGNGDRVNRANLAVTLKPHVAGCATSRRLCQSMDSRSMPCCRMRCRQKLFRFFWTDFAMPHETAIAA